MAKVEKVSKVTLELTAEEAGVLKRQIEVEEWPEDEGKRNILNALWNGLDCAGVEAA